MWDDMDESLTGAWLNRWKLPLILLLAHVACHNTKLLAIPATHYYFNSDIPKAEQSRAEYRHKYDLSLPLEVCKYPFEDQEKKEAKEQIFFSVVALTKHGHLQVLRYPPSVLALILSQKEAFLNLLMATSEPRHLHDRPFHMSQHPALFVLQVQHSLLSAHAV
ncbi:hypothetical protein Tco_1081640 [Tanacetum coccineum]|uniref:Uncharacterized protein n=1 Tax=Tanacetum coccineum TaxID=301880 RepID=A0ABQ5HYH6_9ASTR